MRTRPNILTEGRNLQHILDAVGRFPRPELIFGLSDREIVDWINFQLRKYKASFKLARSTFSEWRREWREEGENSAYLQRNPEVLAFVSFLAELEINSKLEILQQLWDAKGHVQAEKMKWFLERRWKDEFAEDGGKTEVHITGIQLTYNAKAIDVPLITSEQEMLELDVGQPHASRELHENVDSAYEDAEFEDE